MNTLRLAILTIILALFGANVLTWYVKTKHRAEYAPAAQGQYVPQQQQPVQPVQTAPPVQSLPQQQPQYVQPAPQPQYAQPQPQYAQPAPVITVPRTYKQALQLALQTNRPVFLFFTKTRCDYCDRMKAVLNDPQIAPLLSQYIVYCINTDGPEGYVAREAGIQGVPYIVICTGDRQVIKSCQGYRGRESFQAWLQQ